MKIRDARGGARGHERGQSLAEFALMLPFALLLIAIVVEAALLGVRSIVAEHAAFRAARVAEVFQGEVADVELHAMLSPALFRGGLVQFDSEGRDAIVDAFSRPIASLRALAPAGQLRRTAPRAKALPEGLSDAVLRGGDMPSPYCRKAGAYGVCGYPE